MVVSIENPARMKFVGTSGLEHIKMFVVYILQSNKDGKYYIGSTGNINERILRHNNGQSKYTKGRGPFKLIYKEEYETLSKATKREYYLKSLKSRVAIEKLIKQAAFV